MLLFIALAACSNDFSNAIFQDDAGFLDALPTSQQLSLSYPVPDTGMAAEDEQADLYTLTVNTLTVGGSVLDLATGATERVLTLPPTERGEDYRVWGPVPYDPAPDYFLRVEMTRSSTGATYTYAFQLAQTSAGPWFEFLEGSHDVGEEVVALGEGSIAYRDLATDASVDVTYDLREGRQISAVVDALDLGTGPIYQAWTWTEGEDGGAELFYVQPADAIASIRGKTIEELSVDSRWEAEGAGRGEATLTGGDLGADGWQLHQCWDTSGAVDWSWDSAGWLEASGADTNCVID